MENLSRLFKPGLEAMTSATPAVALGKDDASAIPREPLGIPQPTLGFDEYAAHNAGTAHAIDGHTIAPVERWDNLPQLPGLPVADPGY